MNLQTEGTSWLNIGLVGVCVFYRSWQNLVGRPQKEGAHIVFFYMLSDEVLEQNFVNHRHAIELLNLSSLNFDACQ